VNLDWHGCYDQRWSGVIVDEAMRHPAKFSRGLIERIYRHLLAAGHLRPGDLVGDPFGGVALGAWPARRRGLHWVGVELEPRFVELGRANLDLWQRQFGDKIAPWGQAALVQGDSRRLAEVLAGAGLAAVVSSPPYAQGCAHQGGADHPERVRQLGRAAYGPGCDPDGQPTPRYGAAGGQLANLPAGNLDAVISSPPYEGSVNQSAGANDAGARLERMRRAGIDVTHRANVGGANGVARRPQSYGDTPGQVGAEAGETFWASARLIVEQCYTLLKPGGVAVWVVKDFVRRKQIVPFAARWQQLGEACGFETIEVIRAWLVKPGPTQLGFAGTEVDHTVQRKSFFRRLHERKFPHLAIDWEVVQIQRKIGGHP
jgi:hypothetical protein